MNPEQLSELDSADVGPSSKGIFTIKERVSRIFVVDDEKIIAQTLATILQRWGFAASFFVDPLEALSIARWDVPDLLISDVMMPHLSGVELAIRMKELYPKCKVLLFSGHASTMDMLLTAREQGHDFHLLTKPVYPSDLLRGLKYLAEGKLYV